MISIDRLEEMAIEELETKLNNWKEQVELQSNFIDSLLKATNNSEWLNKTILDDEASEIIEKIELDYIQLDQLKTENEELKVQNIKYMNGNISYQLKNSLYKQTLTEIKEIAITGLEGFCPKCSRKECEDNNCIETAIRDILQKISECEGNDE